MNIPPRNGDEAIPSITDIEQTLSSHFKAAAASVTQLYKEQSRIARLSYQSGYSQCLQDMWAFISSLCQQQQQQQQSFTYQNAACVNNNNSNTTHESQGGTLNTVDVSLVKAFMRAKQDQMEASRRIHSQLRSLSSETPLEESKPSIPPHEPHSSLSVSTDHTFSPCASSASPQLSAEHSSLKRSWNVGPGEGHSPSGTGFLSRQYLQQQQQQEERRTRWRLE